MKARFVITLAAALLGLAAMVALGAAIGTVPIPAGDAARIIAARAGLPITPDWPSWVETIVINVRLPRLAVAACAGAGLACAGAALQGLFRNPLADPGILGVSAGAALGAVVAIFSGVAARLPWILPLFAFVGAALALLTVLAVAVRGGQTLAGTLLLSGVAVSALAIALTSFVVNLALADWQVATQILRWTMGGLDGRTWDHAALIAPLVGVGAAAVFLRARDLDALLLGELHAAAVGVDVSRTQRWLVIWTAVITAGVVAAAGPIGFVGLVVPHGVRLVIGPLHRRLLPTAMIFGAVFVIAADAAARTLIAPEEMALGVVTALAGGPLFLGLLIRRREELGI